MSTEPQTEEKVLLFEIQDHMAIITLNRPAKRNALNKALRTALCDSLTEVGTNPDIWLGIVTGRGQAFSSGHDLLDKSVGGPSHQDLYRIQQGIYKPMISAINGYCLAQGCGIALGTDIRVASEKATFGWPQVKRGISSISGPTLLARAVPLNKAFEILFLGETINAQQALELQLLNKVVPDDQVMATALNYAERILANAPLAVRTMKEATLRSRMLRPEEAYYLAETMFHQLERSEDAQEGIKAFGEKRAPVWKGR